MNYKILICYLLLASVCNSDVDIEKNLIVDYFYYKKISSVIGYSCNSLTGDENKKFIVNIVTFLICLINNIYN